VECAIDLTIGLLEAPVVVEGAVEGGEEQAWECEKELPVSKVLGVGFDKTPGDSENLVDFRECTFGYEVNGSRHDLVSGIGAARCAAHVACGVGC
jgi:hypothetical protein